MRNFIILFTFLFTIPVFSQAFLVPSEKRYSPLQIKYHRVEVDIDGAAAKTKIRQVFVNPYNYDLEGTYLFPMPDRANVLNFRMKMNGKWVSGKVLEKNQARNIYQSIVNKMRDPGLIEFVNKNMFKARVYPIPKKGEMEIELTYTQVLPFEAGIYSYKYPMKKGTLSYQNTKEDFTFTANIKSSTPIKSVYSPSHKMDVMKKEHKATVGFEKNRGNLGKDVKLFYTVSKKDIGASLLAFKGDEDKYGYFMLMLSPKSEIKDKEIENKNLLLVVDTSGSMAGDKIIHAKKSLKYIVKRLNKKDKFNIIRFSSGVDMFKDGSVYATEENVKKALKYIEDLYASGGTAIDEALKTALQQRVNDLTNLVIFITDGKPTVGETETKEIVKNIDKKGDNTKIFTFGIGEDLNALLLDAIAAKKDGSSDYLKEGTEIETKISSFYDRVAFPVLLNTKLSIKNIRTLDIYPTKIPALFKGQQLYVFGRYKKEKGKSALLVLSGDKKGKREKYEFEVDFKSKESNDFIPHIWATQKVGFLLEELRLKGDNKELVDEVTRLGKKFGIVTPYTSYLVTEPGTKYSESERKFDKHRYYRGGKVAKRTNRSRNKAMAVDSLSTGGTGSGGGGYDMDDESSLGDGFGKGSMKEESGSVAVRTSKNIQKMKKDTTVKSNSRKKVIGSKTFIYKGGVWVDTVTLSKKAKTINIQYMSKKYFKLLKNKKLKRYLVIGENIDIYIDGYVISIRSKTSESKIPSKLLK